MLLHEVLFQNEILFISVQLRVTQRRLSAKQPRFGHFNHLCFCNIGWQFSCKTLFIHLKVHSLFRMRLCKTVRWLLAGLVHYRDVFCLKNYYIFIKCTNKSYAHSFMQNTFSHHAITASSFVLLRLNKIGNLVTGTFCHFLFHRLCTFENGLLHLSTEAKNYSFKHVNESFIQRGCSCSIFIQSLHTIQYV